MSAHDAGGEFVPIVPAPVELVNHRRVGERGVGCPSGDDDLSALFQCFDYRTRAEVDICAYEMIPDKLERLARLHVLQIDSLRFQRIHASKNVIPNNDADLESLDAELAGNCKNCVPAAERVHAAAV